jgi:anti-anti-sigma factor
MAVEPDQLSWVNGVPVIRPDTEIDAANADHLRAAIAAAGGTGPSLLVIDMGDTAFCDSTGLNVLVRAHRRLEEAGGELRLVARQPTLLRIFSVTGMDSMFRIFPTLGAALAAPRVPGPAAAAES